MTISVADFQHALRRGGMGSPVIYTGGGEGIDQATGMVVRVDDSQGGFTLGLPVPDSAVVATLGQDKTTGATAWVPTVSAPAPAPAPQAGPSTAQEIANLVSSFAPLALQGAQLGLTASGVIKPPAPATTVVVSQPLSTAAKVGIGLAGVGVAGGLAYALWPKKTRRRR